MITGFLKRFLITTPNSNHKIIISSNPVLTVPVIFTVSIKYHGIGAPFNTSIAQHLCRWQTYTVPTIEEWAKACK